LPEADHRDNISRAMRESCCWKTTVCWLMARVAGAAVRIKFENIGHSVEFKW